MSKMELTLNRAGVRRLLRSEEMTEACMRIAQSAQAQLGDGYEAEARHYPERNGASVFAVSRKAQQENADTNSILKAVMSSR
mgnify:FL=1|nr:MAG TPA: type I neck protein [Caudoviricetes sp.]